MHFGNIREEELKNKIARTYFRDFDCTQIIGNIDFCVTQPENPGQNYLFETKSFLWAESKKGRLDIYKFVVQLILTIDKARTFDKQLPPAYLGAFDGEKIAFLPYNSVQEVFYQSDFNWNVTPSNHETKEFKQLLEKVRTTIDGSSLLFALAGEGDELRVFIKNNFFLGSTSQARIQIDKNNFLTVYNKWLKNVKPTIAAN